MNKFYEIVDKIGKHNFILIIFIFIVLIVTGLYQTFSLYTASEGMSIVDGIETYKFILDASNNTNSVTIAANNSKNIAITVANDSEIDLSYGIYYSTTNLLSDINSGYLSTSKYPAKGIISSQTNYSVLIKIDNLSAEDITIDFGLKYGFPNGGELELEGNKHWLKEYTEPTFVNYIKTLYEESGELTTINIGDNLEKPKITLNTTTNIMLDNNKEYRYYGANPNNYVSFNDELWRIISISNVKTDIDDKEGSMRIKIIKDESIDNYLWNSEINDWTKDATLNTVLNETYYNSLTDFSKELIDKSLWYLGGISEDETLDFYPNDFYVFERGSSVYECNEEDADTCPRATNWSGMLSLMYPSDYLYATDLSTCIYDANNYGLYEYCKENNWLLDTTNNQWTLTPSALTSNNVYYISLDGSITSNLVSELYAIRPTAYLKPNVMITTGDGTIDSPYQLTID
ncbi:MAG: hypothetical protein IJ509_03890 [Bacilli bacterium]|nr:hypothetical protein [Bacilli bacterium]